MRHLKFFIAACLLAVAVGVPATASATPPAEYLGVNVQPLMKPTTIPEATWNNYLGPLQTAGLTAVRHDVNWFNAEPTAPVGGVDTYNWNLRPGTRDSIDFQMTALVSHGITVSPSFTGLPTWARTAQSKTPESWFGQFSNFVAAFATRYGPNGAFWAENPQLPYLPVVNYEIWNEANSANSWTGKPDAAGYGRMLQIVYPKVKAAQPSAVVEASIGWPDANNFVDGIAGAGGGGSFDAIAYHPYAPIATSIIGLVTSMSQHLAAIGRPGIPVNVTETGQPVALAPPYNDHAYMGGVSDSARAATQSFAADALARSDCNTNEFLVYAITGSETNKEILSEGFMGIERIGSGELNVTGQALSRASLRWKAAVANGTAVSNGLIGLCSGAVTPRAALLPLGISATFSSHGCITGTVTYDGNPLEGSTLFLNTADGRTASTSPNAFGQSDVCIPNGKAVDDFQVHAEVPNTALSATITCYVSRQVCDPPVTNKPLAAPACTILFPKISPKHLTVGKKSNNRITGRLSCPTFKSTKTVYVKKKIKTKSKSGKTITKTVLRPVYKPINPVFTVAIAPAPITSKKTKKTVYPKDIKLRTLTMIEGKKVTFTLRRTFKTGQKLVFTHAITKKDKLPKLRIAVPIKIDTPKKKSAPTTAKK